MKIKLKVGNRKNSLLWSVEAAAFVPRDESTTFDNLREARAAAKACKGRVYNYSDFVRLIERSTAPVWVVDILESRLTMTGNLAPILIMTIERALDRGNKVEVELVVEVL